MIYTVTLNPALDYIVTVNHFKTGQINHTDFELVQPGGKGINVSVILRNLGHESKALGFIGGFTGDALSSMVEEKGVASDFIKVNNGATRINVKMRSDEETEINGRGPSIDEEEVNRLYEKLDQLKEGDVLVLSGSIPSSLPDTIYMDIMKRLEGKGVLISVDATGELLTKVLPYHPFLIKPNNHELGEIYDTEIRTKEEALFYAGKLQKKGARNVLISMAGEGAVLLSEDGQKIRGEAPKGKVLNSVGAGDSMVAGFLAGWLDTHDYHKAFRLGVCAGSATAFHEELATGEQIRELEKESSDLFENMEE